MDRLDFIYKRHSIRKFTDMVIPMEDIEKIIQAATYAANGKNVQNWHFVVVKGKEKVEHIAKTIENKNASIAEKITDEKMKKSFIGGLRFQTFIRQAPVVILVFAGPYPITGLEVFEHINATDEDYQRILKPSAGIQNVAAAMENLQLAACNLGYGGCWMTAPNYAGKEIAESVGFNKEGYYLMAMTPLGVPEKNEMKSPPRKPLSEIMTVIE